jgi:GAF domain-containing protein
MTDRHKPQDPSGDRRLKSRRQQDRYFIQRNRELEVAQSISEALFQQIQSERLMQLMLLAALKAVDGEAGSVLLADRKAKTLLFRAVIGEKAEQLAGMSIPWSKGLAGAVFTSGIAEVIPDVVQDHRHHGDLDLRLGFRTRDMLILPLQLWGEEPIGVLEVLNKRTGRFGDDDLEILTTIGALWTAALEQGRLFGEKIAGSPNGQDRRATKSPPP